VVIEEGLQGRFAPAAFDMSVGCQKRQKDIPVKNPVLDTAIVIAGSVASCRDGVYDLGLPVCLD
jgi:hypothetical protein